MTLLLSPLSRTTIRTPRMSLPIPMSMGMHTPSTRTPSMRITARSGTITRCTIIRHTRTRTTTSTQRPPCISMTSSGMNPMITPRTSMTITAVIRMDPIRSNSPAAAAGNADCRRSSPSD